jgi:hypothetical protein
MTIFNVLSNDEGFAIDELGFEGGVLADGMWITSASATVRAIIRHGDPSALSSSSFSMWLDGVRIVKDGVPAAGYSSVSLPNAISRIWTYALCSLEAGEHTFRLRLRDAQGRERVDEVTFFVDDEGPEAELVSKYITYNTPVVVAFTDISAVDRTSVTMYLYGTDEASEDLEIPYTLLNFEEVDGMLLVSYHLPIDALNSLLIADPYHYVDEGDYDDQQAWWMNSYNQIGVGMYATDLVGNSLLTAEGDWSDLWDEGDFVGMIIVDIVDPTITPVEPVGMPFDNDGDGIANEDGFDRFDDDNDGLYDEDPEDYEYVILEGGVEVVVVGTSDPGEFPYELEDLGIVSYQPIDNDGDGRFNEDGPNSIDNDGDGLFNEDPIDYAGEAIVTTQFPVIHANFYDPPMQNGNVITAKSRSGIDPSSLVFLLTDKTRGITIDLTEASMYGEAAYVSEAEAYWAASEAFLPGEYTVKIEIADNAGNLVTLPEAWTFVIVGEAVDAVTQREVQWAAKQAMIAPAEGGGDPETRTVGVVVRDVVDVLGYQTVVKYDVAFLTVTDVQPGTFLGGEGETAGVMWDPKPGQVTITDARLGDGGQGGTGVLAWITFEVVPGARPTRTHVNLAKTAIWNPAGQKRWIGPDALEMHVRWWNAADMNYDGVVDGADLIKLAMAFGTEPGDADWNPEANLQFDGQINVFDVVAFKKQFGKGTQIPGLTKPVLPEGAGVFSLTLPQDQIPA